MADQTYQSGKSPSSSMTFFIDSSSCPGSAESSFPKPLHHFRGPARQMTSQILNSLALKGDAVLSLFASASRVRCFLRQLCKPNKSHNHLAFYVLVCDS